MMTVNSTLKAALGVVALVIVVILVSNWIGDFRSAGDADTPGSRETTGSAPATKTPSGEAQGGSGGGTTPTAAGSIGTVTVLVDGLNFRAEPSRDAELIRGLDAGEKLLLLVEQESWLKVKDSAGAVGYVSSSSQYTTVQK